MQQGYLVIADITGYTAYLEDSELDHARDSLTSLLDIMIEHTRLPLVVTKLEGDAVFSYSPDDSHLYGQALLEMIEGTYVAFRRALQLMVLNTTCTCNACKNLSGLDLKFFVHHGTFTLQKVGGGTELLGSDVNLIHRILKNHIVEQTDLRAYAAYTSAAVDHGLSDLTQSMTQHSENYEPFGEVTLFLQDLQGVWKRKRDELNLEIAQEDVIWSYEKLMPVPQPVLWDYVTKPEYRSKLTGASSTQIENVSDGRTGVGSVYVCAHGTNISLQTIVDWQPFERYTTTIPTPLPGTTGRFTYELTPADGGTLLRLICGKNHGSWLFRKIADIGIPFFLHRIPAAVENLRAQIEADIAEGRTIIPEELQIVPAATKDAATKVLR